MGDESKNVDIFSLYTRERIISHTDDQKRKIEILLVKMTQRERRAALDVYSKFRIAEEKRLRKDEEENQTQSKVINVATKAQLIIEILDYEKAQRVRYSYIYPLKDEEKLTKEEKKKKIDEIVKKWEKERRTALEKEDIKDLRKTLLEYTFEGLSVIEAGRIYDYAALALMCINPKTKEKIFKDHNQVEEVRDRKVLDWLVKELKEFQKIEFGTDEEQIKEAKSDDFFTNGGSQKQSGENPPLKN